MWLVATWSIQPTSTAHSRREIAALQSLHAVPTRPVRRRYLVLADTAVPAADGSTCTMSRDKIKTYAVIRCLHNSPPKGSYYFREMNGVKLAEVMFCLLSRLSVRLCAVYKQILTSTLNSVRKPICLMLLF